MLNLRTWYVLLLAAALVPAAIGQTLKKLINQPPVGAGAAYLLTDGTVLAQGGYTMSWWKLTPDVNGSYLNGTWSQVASLPAGYSPVAFSGAVLADGRVVIAGGEYNFGIFLLTNQAAIYDPLADTWTPLPAPDGWNAIGDSEALVLPDGRFLLAQKTTSAIAALDPATLTWTSFGYSGKTAGDFNSEEGWTLLPDGTILTADVLTAPAAEIYNPGTQSWQPAGSTPVQLRSPSPIPGCLVYPGGCYYPPGEIGPQMLRPDGTVFVAGSALLPTDTGHSAVYHPAAGGNAAYWTAGPDFPKGDNAGDNGAVLLPSGNVLVGGDNSGNLYEFDGVNLTSTVHLNGGPVLMLPTGEALVEGAGVRLYRGAGTYNAAWQPTVRSVSKTLTHGSTYAITGTQFNGLSQAAAFGDEFVTATNYPLVRITNTATKHVFYCRTHGHSSMGVATGSAIVSTNFDVPAGIELGASTLQVVANGIPSKTVAVTVN